MKTPLKKTVRIQSETIGGGYLSEPLLASEKPFSTRKYVDEISQEHIQQVRNWKNRVIEIRDLYKGTDSYVTWDLEARRIVEFLNSFNSSLD